MFQEAAEDAKDDRKFFQTVIQFDEAKVSGLDQPPLRRDSSGKLESYATVDFYQFYQQAIKGRVQKKLEEEEEKKFPAVVPSVTINLDDDESHPTVITAEESPASSLPVEATPPRKLPRRRGGPTDLSKIA